MRTAILTMTVALTLAPGFPFNLTNRTGAIALVLDPSGHPVGMYSRKPCFSSTKSTSSIITTNRNNTATAPT